MMWNLGFIVFIRKTSVCTHNEFYALKKLVKKATLCLSNIFMRLDLPASVPSDILGVLLRHRGLFRTQTQKEEWIVLLCPRQSGAFLHCEMQTEHTRRAIRQIWLQQSAQKRHTQVFDINLSNKSNILWRIFKTFLHTGLENVTYLEPEAGWHLLWVRTKRGLY